MASTVKCILFNKKFDEKLIVRSICSLHRIIHIFPQGLSRVAARIPGFPRLVLVTSGSFSGCLLEVRDTVNLGGASRDSTGFDAMEEGLISS